MDGGKCLKCQYVSESRERNEGDRGIAYVIELDIPRCRGVARACHIFQPHRSDDERILRANVRQIPLDLIHRYGQWRIRQLAAALDDKFRWSR
jgi:hypothetical protein